MKFWQAVNWIEAEQLMEIAKFAEEVGFHGVFNADHGVYPKVVRSTYPASPDGKAPMSPDWPYPDCWVTIAAMAAVTTRLHFSTSVYVLPLRSPWEVAKAAGTLGIISNNRFILGMGVGWMKEEFDIYGVDFHTRGKRTDEMIELMRKIWDGGMVEYHGKHFDLPAFQISPAPSKTVPIYVGGASTPAHRRAAYLCDGWIGAGNTPEEVPGVIVELNRLRKEAGRDHLPFEMIFPVSAPPSADMFKRLEGQGMTAGFSLPFTFELGMTSTLEQKKRVMERFSNEVIHRMS